MEQKKIKVIEIIADSDLSGGPTHVLGLLEHLDKKTFQPYLICPNGNLSREAKKIKEVEVFNIKMASKFQLSSVLKIRRTIEKIQVEGNPFAPLVVHVHGIRAGFLARLSYPKSALMIYTEHRFDADYHLNNFFNEFFQKKILKKLNKRTKIIIAVSSSVQKFLIESGMSDKEKTVVIPNGISLKEKINSNKKTKNDSRSFIIGTIGSLNKQKGHRYLIEAMPKVLENYPLSILEIIGQGEEKSTLKKLAKRLAIEKNVSFLGQKKDIGKYLKEFDLFVLPSVAETFGIVILEAMRAGVPVIASSVGGIRDIIKNNKNGILVKSADSKALSKAIVALLDHPVLAAKIKREGLKRVQDFDWQKIIKKIEEVYIGLVINDEKDFS